MNPLFIHITNDSGHIWPDYVRVFSDYITQWPGSTLVNPVFPIEKKPHQFSKTLLVLTDIADDFITM
jgi:hypothetical protein